jgi:hypothetical protein
MKVVCVEKRGHVACADHWQISGSLLLIGMHRGNLCVHGKVLNHLRWAVGSFSSPSLPWPMGVGRARGHVKSALSQLTLAYSNIHRDQNPTKL